MKNEKRLNPNIIISLILRVSSSISIVLMILGLTLFLIRNSHYSSVPLFRSMSLKSVFAGVLKLEPLALMNLGIVVLIATPFMRVIGAFFSFLVFDEDKKYALVSLGVLIIITISFFIPGFKG